MKAVSPEVENRIKELVPEPIEGLSVNDTMSLLLIKITALKQEVESLRQRTVEQRETIKKMLGIR